MSSKSSCHSSHQHLGEQPWSGLPTATPAVCWQRGPGCRELPAEQQTPSRTTVLSTDCLEIFLFQIKIIIYKGERGRYPSVSSSVPTAPGSPCAVSSLAVSIIGALCSASSLFTD